MCAPPMNPMWSPLPARSRIFSARASLLALLVSLIAATASSRATAQGRDFSAFFLDITPSKFVATAFERPYGKAVAAQFATALSDSADSECLKAKRISKEQLSRRAHAILLQRGTFMLDRLVKLTDRDSYLRARIGRDGITEFDRLRNDPNVRAYRAIDEPAELAFIAAYIVENIDRYDTLTRIKLARPISPIASDIQSIQEVDHTEKIDIKLKQMLENDKTGVLARYLEITAMAKEPFRDATDMKLAKKFGPGELLARPGKDNMDLYNELVGLCVARRVPG